MQNLITMLLKHKEKLLWAAAGVGLILAFFVAKELLALVFAPLFAIFSDKKEDEQKRQAWLAEQAKRQLEINLAQQQAQAQRERASAAKVESVRSAAEKKHDALVDEDF